MAIGSRLFDGSGDHLDVASALGLTYPFTFGCFARRNGVATDRLMQVGVAGTDQNYDALAVSSAGAALAISATSTATSTASSTVLLSTDLGWNHYLAVFFSAADRRVYLNGAGKTTSTNSRVPAGRNAFRIGGSLSGASEFSGYIALPAIWTIDLDDAEAVLCAAGALPSAIRPGSLYDYWDFAAGSLTGLIRATVLTATGTSASTEAPAILSSTAPVIQAVTFRAPVVAGKRRTGGVAQSDTTAPSPAPVLATPVSADITTTTVTLSWSASFDAQSGLAQYTVERSATGPSSGFATAQIVANTLLTVQDTGLVPATTYWYRVKAPDNAGNIATSNVVTLTTAQVPVGGPSQTKIWSRTASYALSGTQDYSAASVVAALAMRKFNIITIYPLWEKNKILKADAMVAAVKAASTIGTKMYPYIIYQSIQKSQATPGSGGYPIYQEIAANHWWAYTNGAAETGEVDDAVSTFKKTNYTEAARLVSGQNMRDRYIDWSIGFLRDGATINNGVTTYTHNVNSGWDGLFIDNAFWRERSPNADFDRSGSAESVTLDASADLIQRAHKGAAAKIRAVAPTWQVLCNSADWSEATSANPTKTFAQICAPLDQQFNGGVIEQAIGKVAGYEYRQNFQRFMTAVKVQMDAYRAPKWGVIEQEMPTLTDYKAMRYGLTACLLTDAFIYQHAIKYLSQDLPNSAYDEYEFDLGVPLEPVQTAPRYQGNTTTGQGIWRRDYTNGIVLCGARKGTGLRSGVTQDNYSAQALGGTFYPLRASTYANQDPVANPGGAGITTITLSSCDGRILARVPQ